MKMKHKVDSTCLMVPFFFLLNINKKIPLNHLWFNDRYHHHHHQSSFSTWTYKAETKEFFFQLCKYFFFLLLLSSCHSPAITFEHLCLFLSLYHITCVHHLSCTINPLSSPLTPRSTLFIIIVPNLAHKHARSMIITIKNPMEWNNQHVCKQYTSFNSQT